MTLEPPARPRISPRDAFILGVLDLGLFAGAIAGIVWACMFGIPSALEFLARWAR